MNKLKSAISIILLLATIFTCLTACGDDPTPETVDYATAVKLNMDDPTTAKCEVVSVEMYIDGDTTHFNVPAGITDNGILKARYIAINTPESTGKIEPWGNDAANFTKDKLMSATSIVLESDTATWNVDSTGERRVVWVWYKPEGSDTYRNLNIEILQNGFAYASNSANNRYGSYCMDAIAQAKAESLCVWGKELDPDFPYGEPTDMPLKTIRMNIEDYYYLNVYFEGTIIQDDGGTIYLENYDEETGMYYGITAYYKTSGLTGDGLKMIKVGNRIKVVGVITYFEGGDIWQISDLYYDPWEPDDPRCLEYVSNGHTPAYPLTSIDTFLGNKVVMNDGKEETFKYADLALNTSISMENLKVVDVYTTNNGGSNDGAMTLTCETYDQNGAKRTVTVRTAVLTDSDGRVITEDYFLGKTMNVKGIVEEYDGSYQIKVFSVAHVSFVG